MAKVLKKFLALVLVLAVVMSMTGMTAFAMDDDETIVETEATVVIDADEGEENDEAPVEEETPVEDEAPAEEAAPVEEEAPAEEEAILDIQSEEDEAEEVTYVAQIGDNKYETLQAAIEAAEGGTIKLVQGEVDWDMGGKIVHINGNVTIDLNNGTLNIIGVKGSSISARTAGIDVAEDASLTIQNGTVNCTSETTTDWKGYKYNVLPVITVQQSGSVTLDEVTFNTNCSAIEPKGNAATVKVIGSTIEADSYAVATNANNNGVNGGVEIELTNSTLISHTGAAVLLNVPGTLNVDNCTLTGASHGLVVRGGTAVVKNSTIKRNCPEYTKKESETMSAALRAANAKWSQGNQIPFAAITLGNKGTNYQYPTKVTLIDTTVVSHDDNNVKFPAIYVYDDGKSENTVTLVITGGTIDKETSEGLVNAPEDGKATIKIEEYVAKIKETGVSYTTLQAAIDAADGATVTLLADVTESVTVAAGQNITLDLNGKTLTNEASNHTITNKGTLTVIGEGTVDNVDHGKAALFNEGTATLNGGIFTRSAENGTSVEDANGNWTNSNGGNSWYTICNQGKMEINDGVTVSQDGSFSSLLESGWVKPDDAGERTAEITINGGSFVGGKCTLKNDSHSTMTVKGGTFTQANNWTVNNYGTMVIEGGDFTSERSCIFNGQTTDGGTATGSLTISGGKFTYSRVSVSAHAEAATAISGGIYSTDVTEYCVEGYKAVLGEDDLYHVVEKVYVAQVGNTKYETLQAAINAAQDGATVVLLADVDTAAFINVNKSITINGGNHKVNSTASRILRVTVDNVTVTLNDIEFIGANAERGVQVDVSKTGVELNINGCTIPATKYAVNICNYTSVALNINDSTIRSWGALNLWGDNYEVKVTNSTLIGHNDKGYSEAGWNGFGVVVLEGDTTGKTDEHVNGCHVVLEDCHIIASTVVNADGTANVQKAILFNSKSTNNTVEITGDQTVVEYTQGDLTPFCAQNGSENTITISGGTFSSEVELSHCAEGYLPVANADGTYGVVKHTPEITADPDKITGAGTVTLTVNVPSNLSAEIEVTGKNVETEETITVTPAGDRTYTVSLPNATATYVFRVDIGDLFTGEGVTPPSCVVDVTRYTAPVTPVTPSEPDETDEPTVEIDDEGTALADRPFLFEDVLEDDWFYGDVKNIFENGLINGTTTTTYEPQTELSRGMIVTILWRIAGEPTVETTSTFADVPENAYYFDAINWGAENNIARGYDEETFAPDKLVSREELAAFIYRYAELIELDLTEIDEDAFAEFGDADSVQEFAITAMKWAVSAGIIKGDDGMLNPQNSATRAEAAAMINRFIQLPEVAAVMEANAETEGETEAE